ncbi:MAG: CocE/NonD family hydrolase [Ginsengibacter sp.]
MKKTLSFFILLISTAICFAQNQDSIWFVNNYTKKEVYIPMRDGVKLFTSLYIPKNQSSKNPFLFTRTPYSCAPYGEDKYINYWGNYMLNFARQNVIFVKQDVRGRYMSEGVFEDVRPFNKSKKGKETDEASDTYDAIEWLVKNIEKNNGKVGVMGTSYPGFYSAQAALSGHPALVAVSPQAPVTDWFMGDDFHHNGAFFLMDAFSFYPTFGQPRPKPTTSYNRGFSFQSDDNYKAYLKVGALKNFSALLGDSIAFWKDLMSHPNYDDWWKARDARNGLYNIKPAMLWVGGLFDAEDTYGAWNSYKAAEKQSPKTNNRIVMGPWYHGQWSREGSFLGNVRFGANTSKYYQDSLETPFFQYYLFGKKAPELSEATIFFTGENNWRKLDVWPPANVENVPFYLGAGGTLSLKNTGDSNKPFEEYISDPQKPVPYTQDIHFRRTKEYMTDDQRFASRRTDVLTFETDILAMDVTVAGPVTAALMTSISTTDADFVVKLIDVFPDDFKYPADYIGHDSDYPMGGYQMLVRGEIMRGKFRNSFEKPEPFVPGKITEVKWALPDVAHTFKKGHSIMIQVQSSWFPLADRNPQKFLDIYKADDSDFQKSTIRIFHDGINASKIVLPVVGGER